MRRNRWISLFYLFVFTAGVVASFNVLWLLIGRWVDRIPKATNLFVWLDDVFWIDSTLLPEEIQGTWQQVTEGGSRGIIVSILVVVASLWFFRFLVGAIEELKLDRSLQGMQAVLCLVRWSGFSVLGLLAPPFLSKLIYELVGYTPVNHVIRVIAAAIIFLWISLYVWHYPDTRIQHVEEVSRYKSLHQRH